jgi:broad-specificity NMP kinase
MRSIYILSGTLGAGKTTCSHLLRNKLGLCSVVHIDDVTLVYKESDLGWDNSLKLAWGNILYNINESSKYINSPFIVDCVVDKGEEHYLETLSENNQVYYFNLIASKEVLESRLSKRGDTHMLERQLEVLNLIKNDPIKLAHSLDTTNMKPEEVASYIVDNKNSFIFKPEVL